jgi:hypothetical protein
MFIDNIRRHRGRPVEQARADFDLILDRVTGCRPDWNRNEEILAIEVPGRVDPACATRPAASERPFGDSPSRPWNRPGTRPTSRTRPGPEGLSAS